MNTRSQFRLAALVFSLGQSAVAQNTVQFGFEEFPAGAHPPFVKGLGVVADSSGTPFIQCPPFEGTKYLASYGLTSIGSPDGQEIASYQLHLFVLPSVGHISLQIGGQSMTLPAVSTWETFQGALPSPLQRLDILVMTGIEPNGSIGYAIDGVQLTTIPEPQTFWLAALGVCAVLASSSAKLRLAENNPDSGHKEPFSRRSF